MSVMNKVRTSVLLACLLGLVLPGCAFAGTRMLAWDAPTNTVDATPIPAGTPLYYRIYDMAGPTVITTIVSSAVSTTTSVTYVGRKTLAVSAAFSDDIAYESEKSTNIVVNFSKPDKPTSVTKQ